MIKKVVTICLIVVLVFAFAAVSVMAGGDKVHGENATGPANQEGECPFGGEDAGGNNAGEGPHR